MDISKQDPITSDAYRFPALAEQRAKLAVNQEMGHVAASSTVERDGGRAREGTFI